MLHLPNGNGKGCLTEMVETYNKTGGNVISVYEVPTTRRTSTASSASARKPAPRRTRSPDGREAGGRHGAEQPRHLRPLHPPAHHLRLLAKQEQGAGNEIQLTDSMLKLMERERFFSVRFDGSVYDCGSKIGFLMANVAYACRGPTSRRNSGRNSVTSSAIDTASASRCLCQAWLGRLDRCAFPSNRQRILRSFLPEPTECSILRRVAKCP